jgi:hypothetical protein
VHTLLSSHSASTGVNTHPVELLQLSFVQAIESLQILSVPEHSPLKQTSEMVQASSSLHGSTFGV